MAEFNKIRFLLVVSLMIFPACAFDVIVSGAHQDFKQKSVINIGIMNGEKIYRGTLNQLTYEVNLGITKIIVYIISRSRCIEILRPADSEFRSQIARELRENDCEVVFLGIEHIDDDEYHLIGAFIADKILPRSGQQPFDLETIGENRFDHIYGFHATKMYKESAQICGGTLLARLRSIPRGALRPIRSNNKQIKLYGYQPLEREVWWSICVENNTYVPDVDLSDPKNNFMIRYPHKKICLLILSGKEYSAIASHGRRGAKRAEMRNILNQMTKNNEVLIIMGVFNFDWTDIDIVAQIIVEYSKGLHSSGYNIFTCGYGMFNTYYLYVYQGEGRYIRQQSNSYVSEAIKVLMDGEEVKQRAINVYYFDGKWDSLNIPINLGNGRYATEIRFNNFILPCVYQKIAFIVYDFAEINVPIDYSVVLQCIGELEQSGISVVLIEAFNFGSNDMHIIAEWIDRHSGVIDTEQIAVLGGGIFDTIFQSECTTYSTFLNTNKYELETIRNAYAPRGNGKSVFVANIDENSDFGAWSYPMNTIVNGFYEPDLIPDRNMFNSTGEKKIHFIITSAYNFQQVAARANFKVVGSSFRRSIGPYYPATKWNLFMVGLDNFGEKDSHLFAELVKRQTNDERTLEEFVRTINFGMSQAIYQYKDNAPFDIETRPLLEKRFTFFFECKNSTDSDCMNV